jgi:hypothetical protein
MDTQLRRIAMIVVPRETLERGGQRGTRVRTIVMLVSVQHQQRFGRFEKIELGDARVLYTDAFSAFRV